MKLLFLSLFYGITVFTALGAAPAVETVVQHPYPGITCQIETWHEPPMRLFIARIDLTNPRLQVRVSPGGPDPDGAGPWQTTLMRPTAAADREHFVLVVNGDFFSARKVKDGEGTNAHFPPMVWAKVEGVAVTDGQEWSSCAEPHPALVLSKGKKFSIKMMTHAAPEDWEVISGREILLTNGHALPHGNILRHPRTAVGFDRGQTNLVILVVDGRRVGVSIGMTYDDLGKELLALGCDEALNLDGGGSTIMAVRDPATAKMHILNNPSDGHERPVGNVLGVTVASDPNPASSPPQP